MNSSIRRFHRLAAALMCTFIWMACAQNAPNAKRLAIRGTLVDPASFAYPAARIELVLTDAKGQSQSVAVVTPNSAGHFEVKASLQPGRYQVKIIPKGLQPFTIAIPATSDSSSVDLGRIVVKFSCSDSAVICDGLEVKPK
jgi:hypothetical protein